MEMNRTKSSYDALMDAYREAIEETAKEAEERGEMPIDPIEQNEPIGDATDEEVQVVTDEIMSRIL